MAKGKNAVLVDNFDTTEITPHEIVAVPMTAEQVGNQQIQKFGIARAWIADLKEQAKDLKITDPADKEGIKKVTEFWQTARNKRLAVEKKHTELKADSLIIGRMIDKEKNELVSLLKEIEDPAGAELDRIANIKKEAELEKERQAQLKLQNRVSELLENGMSFTGSYYAIGELVSMDVVTLKAMTDQEFAALSVRVKTINADILEQKRLDDEKKENERIALQKQKDDQEAERVRLKGIQDNIDEQNRKLKEQLLKLRSNQITSLGMKYDYPLKTFNYRDEYGSYVFIGMDFVESAEDEPFETELARLSGKIETAKKEAKIKADQAEETRKENERLADEKKKRDARTVERERDIFQAFGMRKDGDFYSISSQIIPNKVAIMCETLETYDTNDWANVINETAKKFKKFTNDEAKRRKELSDEMETKRLSKMSDGAIISDILGRMSQHALKAPELKTADGVAIWKNFDVKFSALIEETEDAINKI